ncbi:aminodeoxychorismate/anthranilate synthase component II [Echinicola strongylocentroti]|uniref:Aminodeoxychorismate/anthranilate synthase component II n=1 Tax=Echinicola strongylocentroti TaxID=1795355 RepID=A0A2Z4IHZ8_9BACT|nr:aminodeoxychorismate/anthranilate synthase component II [Echinicola strongylocentroti]AWW30359.1 aminodeoxychorismate/anthranilate synthase component II [Echinicola strongylocentroti]
MLLLIDNFDSFSHILADYFRQAGFALDIVRNDTPLALLKERKYDGLVLSPGPETPSKAGNLKDIFDYFHDKLPVLGVCLGHQCIGEFFGATLVKGKRPVHGKVHPVIKLNDHPVLNGLPDRFKVTRYHSLELAELPYCLLPLLETEHGELMAMAHRTLPIVGIQFHPEAHLSEYGVALIKNWGEIVRKISVK